MDDVCLADERQLETSFLTSALEAVIRLAEIYAAQQGIQTHPDKVRRLGRAAMPNAGPVRSVEAATATAPAGSPSPERSAGLDDDPPSHEPNETGKTAAPAAPCGWTWGRSTSAQIRAEALGYLRQKGGRAKGREIWEAIKKKGVVVNMTDPVRLVSARIGRSPLFDHTYEGYGLVEWSNSGGRGPK